MKQAHAGLPVEQFFRPSSGLLEVSVCAKSGMLPTNYCNEGTVRELFLAGTEPRDFCDLHSYEYERNTGLRENLKGSILSGDSFRQDFPVPDLGVEGFLESREFSGFDAPGGETGARDAADTNPLLD